MKNTLMSILVAAAVALGAVACTPDVHDQGGQPAPQASHSGSDMLMGGFMGYLLGRATSPSQPATTHVIERTVVKEAPVVSTQPKLHQGQPVVATKPVSSPNIYSKPATNSYSAPSRNVYSSPSRSFSSGRR